MGKTAYAGWALLAACRILFGTLIGVMPGKWKGASRRTRSVLITGFVLPVLTSVITAYSSKLARSASMP